VQEERRQDDKAIAVLSQKLTDFMENTFLYRKGQERIQADIVNKLETIKSTLDKLPCDGRRLVHLENKSWVDKNLIGLWAVVGSVAVAVLADWIRILSK
jgi:hypothetical protein